MHQISWQSVRWLLRHFMQKHNPMVTPEKRITRVIRILIIQEPWMFTCTLINDVCIYLDFYVFWLTESKGRQHEFIIRNPGIQINISRQSKIERASTIWMFYFKNWIKKYTSYNQETTTLICLYNTWLCMCVLRFLNSICFCAARHCKSFSVKAKPVACEPVFVLVNMVVILQSCNNAESSASLTTDFHNWLLVNVFGDLILEPESRISVTNEQI